MELETDLAGATLHVAASPDRTGSGMMDTHAVIKPLFRVARALVGVDVVTGRRRCAASDVPVRGVW